MRTQGTSGKLLATLYGAVGAQLVALLVVLAASGEFDRAAWAQLGGVALTAVGGFVFGYRAEPDAVTFDPMVNVPGGGPELS